jgi:hypothetical protein
VKEDGANRDATDAAGSSVTRRVGRRYGDDDIHRILQTAVELQERSHVVSHDATRGLTLEELRQVAQEAGIDPRFVDLAASDLNAPVERVDGKLAGGALSWNFQASLEGEIGDVDRDQILHAIRSVLGQKGELADVYGRMEWSHDDGSGPIIIGVSTRDGRTEIDVTAAKSTEAGIIHALGISFGGIFGGAAVAGIWGLSGALAVPVVAAMGVVSYGATRLGWRLRSQWWERRLRRVVERISSIVQDVAMLNPGESAEE